MKKQKEEVKQNYPDKPLIKFVKKAGLWAVTKFEGEKQIITWHEQKP